MESDSLRLSPTQAPGGAPRVAAAESAPKSLQIYIDGEFLPQEEAKVSVFDHALLYGDGVFEGIRVYEGCIFRLKDHLDRIYDGARAIMLTIPLSVDEMTQAIAETVRRNDIHDGYIRLVITRGVGTLGLDPWRCKRASVIVIADRIQLYPVELYEKGLAIGTAATLRFHLGSMNGRVKSLNYLNNILAKIDAKNAGYEEALMLDPNGFVVECSGDNIFIVKNRELFTPPAYLGALAGVTRMTVLEVAKAKGIVTREEPFTRYEVYTADECFLTGTAAEAIPVVAVDERPIGDGKPGPITKDLIAGFRARTSKDGFQVYR